ncbi:MAG: beta-ketoacyl-[acyl-carrier-protein] synthase family protein [Planctomycetota bacterium]
MTRRDAVITGIGCISPLGFCPGELSATLADGHTAIGEIQAFDTGPYTCRYAAEVRDFDLADFIDSKKTYLDRTSAFALAACASALREAHWHDDERVGLVLGTAWGCMSSLELFAEKLIGGNPKFVSPLPFTHSYANAPNSLAAIEFKLRGFNACFTCGHVSGMTALECACQRVELGKDARLLAGGSESLSEPVFHAYDLRGLLHRTGEPRPYDPACDGMVLGEGAAVFAVEDAEAARERHATVFARVLGHASASGPSLAQPLGRAMRGALDQAGVAPGEVGLVLGAGCGLPEIDGAEVEAIRSVFGDARPLVTSVKRMVGEAMGAGGPIALATAIVACLEDCAVPPVVLDDMPSPQGLALVVGESCPADVRTVLLNAADPGGACVSLLVAFPHI